MECSLRAHEAGRKGGGCHADDRSIASRHESVRPSDVGPPPDGGRHMKVRLLPVLLVVGALGALPAAALANFIVANSAINSITFYTGLPGSPADGNPAPFATLSGAATGLSAPTGIALSRTGQLFVADRDSNRVTVYAAGASGNAAPLRTIAGSN